jgi:hypothetical protein
MGEQYVKRRGWCNPWDRSTNIHTKQVTLYRVIILEHPTIAPSRLENFNTLPAQQADIGIDKPIAQPITNKPAKPGATYAFTADRKGH